MVPHIIVVWKEEEISSLGIIFQQKKHVEIGPTKRRRHPDDKNMLS